LIEAERQAEADEQQRMQVRISPFKWPQ
jgi:hypothetical protein